MPTTIDDIRDAGEKQLQAVLAKLDKRHRATLLAAVKRYGSVRAIPASVWDEIKRDTEENVVAALLLLMLAADEWTSEEFGGQGLDVRKASDRDVSIYSIKAARRAQRMADLTVETTRDRWARKFEDEALTGDGPVGSTTPEGNERSLDDVLDDARRKATAANETTGSISTGQIDAGRRAEEAAAKEAGRPGTTPTGTPAGDDGAQERPTQRVKVELIWKTERDNRVCPRCSPLEGTNEDVWGLVFPEGPGEEAHPNCRCWLSPQVVVDRVYEAVENCGANAPGGGGFQPGNTCGGEGGSGSTRRGKYSKHGMVAEMRSDGNRIEIKSMTQHRGYDVSSGSIEVAKRDGVWRIMSVHVDDEYRNKGVAFDLVSELVDRVGPVQTSRVFSPAGKKFMHGLVKRGLADKIADDDYLIHYGKKKADVTEHYGPGAHDCGSEQQVHDGQGGACGGSGGGSNRGSSRSSQEEPSQPETPPQQPEPQPASQPERPRVSRAMSAILDEARGIEFQQTPGASTNDVWRGRGSRAFASNDTALLVFKTSKGREFTITAQPDRGYPTEVMFVDNEGSTLETGRGEAHEVFGKVSAAMIAYADKTQSDALSFTGSGASRVRLYHTLAKAFTRMRPDYEAYGGGDDSYAEFYLVKRGTPMHRKVAHSDEFLAQKIESVQPQLVEIEPEFDPAWLTPEWWDDEEKESTQA